MALEPLSHKNIHYITWQICRKTTQSDSTVKDKVTLTYANTYKNGFILKAKRKLPKSGLNVHFVFLCGINDLYRTNK